jgi:formate dehydrogenase major subunit
VPGLGASFGRGRATTAQWELANSDCIVIQGSDMAECHPVAFRFVLQAKQRGATVIHVDPRFTRTSALCDIHVPIRAGTDIALLGGLIHYVLEHERYFRDYVVHYTDAPFLLREDFRDTEDLGGVFSGLDYTRNVYDFSTWQYQGADVPEDQAPREFVTGESFSEKIGTYITRPPQRDDTLQHPRCVFQMLRKHFSRYTPEMVARICGIPEGLFLQVADAITRNSGIGPDGVDRTTAWCYAVGWTQHTTGVQMIRAAGILQLLLGNIGRPGGGILALRGHATIQGSTDIPTLYNLLPGYLPMPNAQTQHETLAAYLRQERPRFGWWWHMPKYVVSLLKAWYGAAATAENDFCYDHLPQITEDHSQLPMTLAMHDGRIKGLFLMGQNPAVGGHNARLVRRGLANLEWLVVRDAFETESASFWYASPEVKRGELDPRQIKTEVFFLPAALTPEKDGSYSNTHALVQYHHKAVDPPADARSEPWFLYWLGRRLKELYAGDHSTKARQLLDLTWDYPLTGPHQEPLVEAILKEINGYTVADHKPVSDFRALKDDGSTACGCWIYSGIYPEDGVNRGASRHPDGPDGPGTHLGWGFSWPANRRIMYNRASARPDGQPWSERKRYVWWDPAQRRWTGYDVPDFEETKPPDYTPAPDAEGPQAHRGTDPFIMKVDGRGALFAETGVKDGPLPTHYEPVDSPVPNALYPEHSTNPVAKRFDRPDNRYHAVGDPRFPYVITTYRLTEHHTGGGMSKYVPWLAELQPHGFIELDPALAAEKGIETGDWVAVSTARGEIETRALVTGRLKPLRINGKLVHQVGMPWHFGYKGHAQGGIANDLTSIVGDPTTTIHEGKVFTCNVRLARKEPVR